MLRCMCVVQWRSLYRFLAEMGARSRCVDNLTLHAQYSETRIGRVRSRRTQCAHSPLRRFARLQPAVHLLVARCEYVLGCDAFGVPSLPLFVELRAGVWHWNGMHVPSGDHGGRRRSVATHGSVDVEADTVK
jgi:hypothetical protein